MAPTTLTTKMSELSEQFQKCQRNKAVGMTLNMLDAVK